MSFRDSISVSEGQLVSVKVILENMQHDEKIELFWHQPFWILSSSGAYLDIHFGNKLESPPPPATP